MPTDAPYDICPASNVGDLQLEVILTPLLFNRAPLNGTIGHTPYDTQPHLSIVDIGCGAARLAGAFVSFPPHVIDRLNYTGCETSNESVDVSKHELIRLSGQPQFDPIQELLNNRSQVHTWQTLRTAHEATFDVAYVVNVLHHVDLATLPSFLMDVVSLVKDGGFVVLHDFYLADDPKNIDTDKYCNDSIFLSPLHYTALFSMASTQTGNYRTIERRAPDGRRYDLFTMILHVENELTKGQYEDDYISYIDIGVAMNVVLGYHNEEVAKWVPSPWQAQYVEALEGARQHFSAEWPYDMEFVPATFMARRALGIPLI